jgi:hypothetical protein
LIKKIAKVRIGVRPQLIKRIAKGSGAHLNWLELARYRVREKPLQKEWGSDPDCFEEALQKN